MYTDFSFDDICICHLNLAAHYSDVAMSAMASQITGVWMFAQPLVQAQIKENIKDPRHWPLWGESIGDRWIPLPKGQ